jgi:hypothetical protein
MEPGITDDEVLAIANRVQAILITADRDFGEIVFRRRLHTQGIILYDWPAYHRNAKPIWSLQQSSNTKQSCAKRLQ